MLAVLALQAQTKEGFTVSIPLRLGTLSGVSMFALYRRGDLDAERATAIRTKGLLVRATRNPDNTADNPQKRRRPTRAEDELNRIRREDPNANTNAE